MLSNLSRVPPVKPNPLPDIIGTLKPNAAKAGAKIKLILSPIPPVLCLSTNKFSHSFGKIRVSPDSVIDRVSSTVSATDIPLR